MAKATQKQALGRGLSALLNDPKNDIQSAEDKNADQVVGNVIELPLDQIAINPFQPRTHFDQEGISELANSIKELGIIQPITVRKIGFQSYQLISGERRFRAVKQLEMESIPAFIRIANDQESLEMALVENIQRRDLDPIEIALSYQRLIEDIQLTQEQMSARVGKKRPTIANYLRLLKLDPIIQTGMRDGFLSMGHGRALVNVESKTDQLGIYEKILAKGLSVRATEQLVKELKAPKVAKKTTIAPTENIQKGIEGLKKSLPTGVSVTMETQTSGKIILSFGSEADFKKLQKQLKK